MPIQNLVSFADGRKRTVVTNARGIYRVIAAPEGEAAVSTAIGSVRTSVVAGTTAHVDVHASPANR